MPVAQPRRVRRDRSPRHAGTSQRHRILVPRIALSGTMALQAAAGWVLNGVIGEPGGKVRGSASRRPVGAPGRGE